MCRALQVVCVASGEPSLQTLKRAVISEQWELTVGATTDEEALDQLKARRAHVLVVWGAWDELVKRVRDSLPSIRIIAVGRRELAGADVTVSSVKGARDAILGLQPPGGPVKG